MSAAGCVVCREGWYRGERPRLLLTSTARQALVFRCDSCGTFWEVTERLAAVLPADEQLSWARDLGRAVVLYVGWGDSRFPRERFDSVEAAFGTSAEAMVADVRALIQEVGRLDVAADADDATRAQEVRRALGAKHPELSEDAIAALAWKRAWDDR
jgi:hypothetical protein